MFPTCEDPNLFRCSERQCLHEQCEHGCRLLATRDRRDRHTTGVITKYGLYEHVSLPFGLCNYGATFNRVMHLVLQGLTWEECLAYLDDVIILGNSFKDHITKLTHALDIFKEYNLKLKLSKCNLFQKEVKFLGKIVNNNGVAVDPKNIVTVCNWPAPKCRKELESFLGFTNHHHDHVERYTAFA